jgi:hypothetical protein
MPDNLQFSLFPHLNPEDANLELKSTSQGRLPDDIWKTISAFSNGLIVPRGEKRHRKYFIRDDLR